MGSVAILGVAVKRLSGDEARTRVLDLASKGFRPKEIAIQLGVSKGYVAGVQFRARGGAKAHRGPYKSKAPKPPKFSPPLIGGQEVQWQPMSSTDKARMAAAYIHSEPDGEWVAIPDPAWSGLGRRPRRHRRDLLSLVRATSTLDAQQLAVWAWGFY